MFLETTFQCPPFKSIVSQMFLKIQRMSEPQSTEELNFRRFEKTRNGGIISDVLKNTTLPSFSKLVSLTSRAISATKLNVQNSTLLY